MNLHSDKEAFKEIIALAAEHFGYEQSHVEKDYWVSKILRDISMSEYADKTCLLYTSPSPRDCS